jgi:tetratricopeptide (TPR) repeat protein
MSDVAANTRRAKVFISYSRRDIGFVNELAAGLEERGFEAFVDKKDIAAGEPWKERISGLIAAADTVAFVVSPASVASPVCGWEIDESARLGKRILPVVSGHVEDADVHPALARLNYIFALDINDLPNALQLLDDALATDLSWIREHTRLTEIALHWDARHRPPSLLLRGREIEEAERWIGHRPDNASQPTAIHRDLISTSRRASRNRQRGWVTGAAVIATVAVGLAVFAEISRQRAENALQVARGTANTLVTDLASELRNKVGMPSGLIKSILGPALALQERLLASAGPDAALRTDQSHALALMSTTLLRIGDTREAVSTATRSREIAQQLQNAEPGNARFRSQLFESLRVFGQAEARAGDLPGALAAFRRCLTLAREAVSDGTDPAATRTLVDALAKVGEVDSAIGDNQGWAEAVEEALTVARTAAVANTPRDRHALIDALVQFSVVEMRRGDHRRAVESLNEAFGLALKDAADDTDAAARAELARTLGAMASSFHFLNQPEAEFASADEGVRISRELAWDKQNYEARESLAGSLLIAGGLKAIAGRAGEAIPELEECVALRRELARDGSRPAARVALADTLFTLAGIESVFPARLSDAIAQLDEAIAIYRASAQTGSDPSASLLKPAEALVAKLRAGQNP